MNVGVVVIGRNEGERLKRCLDSVVGVADWIVYIDSGSTDGSVALARAKGVMSVQLNMSVPFSAAKARNEGFRSLRELAPDLAYVQFVDGDCEIANGWLAKAATFLREHADVSVVCGRLRERYPERSIYNLLCDIEWDAPVGEARASGGIAMVRAAAFVNVGGYRADMIAGEEPELCVRLRAAGWRIWRLDAEMALHDAAMTQFGQWWKRAMRSGHALAEGVYLHGAPPERHCVAESYSVWFWGLGVPGGVFVFAILWGKWALVLLLIYLLQIGRLAIRGKRSARANWWYALFLVLGKFPELLGQIKFYFHRNFGGRARLIEYK